VRARSATPLFVALDWIEAHCVIPDRHRAGEPLRLYDYQLRYLAEFYRVRAAARWIPDDPILAPAFVYRRGLLVGPQKIGKGPGTAAHTCLEGVGPALFAGWAGDDDGYACADHGCGCGWERPYEPGEPMGMPWPTPLIQITAVSEEQTANIYGALLPMIERGPLGDLIPKVGEEFTRLPGGGEIATVTSSANSRLGQRVTFVAQDEVGLWTAGNKMTQVADTQYRGLAGMGGRASLTTNAWDPSEQSVAQREYESSATDIVRQFVRPPKTLSFSNKRERRKILRLVYGETVRERGGHIDLDAIEAEAADLAARDLAQASRFFGNCLVEASGSWLPTGLWDSRAAPRQLQRGAQVCLGFDGSDVEDWTALRAETRDGYRFTPTYGPDRRPTIWNPADWGGRIPRAEVDAAIDELFEWYDVCRMYGDPPDWKSELEAWALRYGDQRVIRWETYRTVQMHSALTRSVTDLTTGASTHDGCPITTVHVGNARKLARPGQRYVLVKPAPDRKIDAAMADTLAHEAAADARAAGWPAASTESFVWMA
jgi:hypothetical protein